MATQTGSIDFTTSNSVKLMAEAGFENVDENYYTKAELDLTVQGINTEVSKKVNGTEIISTINQSAESVSIDASKINLTGTVTISDLANDAQNATLNSNISVGGRNLLTGTGDWSGGVISSGAGTVSGDTFTFAAHDTLDWYAVHLSNPHIPFAEVDGKTLTLSFDYRSDDFSDTTGDRHYIYINAAASSVANGSGRTKYRQISTSTFGGVYVPTAEWQRGNITFTLSESFFNAGSGACNYFFIQFYNYTLNSLQLRHVKLEVGNVATDWSQAQEDLEAYADESAYLSAKPNIAPLGSVEFSDVYNATTNPNGYWRTTIGVWYTRLDDGWIHVYVDNSAGTGAVNSTSFRPSPSPAVVAGKVYTILTEIRNNASTGTSGSNVDFYLQQVNNNQFWGNRNDVVIDDDHVTTTTMVSLLTCGQSYVLRSYRIADTDHLTAGTPSPEMFRYNFRAAKGSVLNFDFRMSVYDGIYDGPYKPYSGTQLFATQTDASNAAKTATSYVTEITGQNGIMVHPSTDDDTGVQITSDVDILRNGYSVINVGTQGDTSGNTDAGVTIYDGTTNENVVATFDGDGIGLVGGAFRLTSERVTEEYGDENNPTTMTEIRSVMKSEGSNDDFETRCFLRSMVGEDDDAYYNTIELTSETDIITQSLTETNNASVEVGSDQWGSSVRLVADSQELHLHKHPVDGKDYFDLHSEVFLISDYHYGVNMWSTTAGTVLWSSGGWYMAANQTANLAYNVSTCPTGIVLHFQPYTSSTTQNYNHIYYFVPKEHVASYSGTGVVVQLGNSDFSNMASKYLYISNDHITGHANNTATGTGSGITYNNGAWVMTQVIAV